MKVILRKITGNNRYEACFPEYWSGDRPEETSCKGYRTELGECRLDLATLEILTENGWVVKLTEEEQKEFLEILGKAGYDNLEVIDELAPYDNDEHQMRRKEYLASDFRKNEDAWKREQASRLVIKDGKIKLKD